MLYFCAVAYAEFVVIDHYRLVAKPENQAKVGKRDDQGRLIQKDSQNSSLLLYEVMIFFMTIFGMGFFLIFSRFFKFFTLRERAGYGGASRYSMDYLEFVSEDVHWFLLTFVQAYLFSFSLFRK